MSVGTTGRKDLGWERLDGANSTPKTSGVQAEIRTRTLNNVSRDQDLAPATNATSCQYLMRHSIVSGVVEVAGWPSYRKAKGGALRPGPVAKRWDKVPGSRVWLLSSAIRSRPLRVLRARVKGSGQECPLYTNQSSGRAGGPAYPLRL